MKRMGFWKAALAALALPLASATAARAGFTYGNLAVIRVGESGGTISDKALKVFIDEYTPGGAFVAAHPIDSAGATALTLGGTGKHDGHLSLSSDFQYLMLGGYRADAGTPSPTATTAAAVNRVIGRVDSNWSANTTTGLTDAYDNTEMTAVISDNGQRFWTAGLGSYDDLNAGVTVYTASGGLRYAGGIGATTTNNLSQTQTVPSGAGLKPDNLRNARIVGGKLYIMTPAPESFVNRGGYYIDFATLPTSGAQTYTPFIVNTEGSGADPQGKNVPKTDGIYLDLDPGVPGIDTAYTTGGKTQYEKWHLVGGTWVKFSNKTLTGTADIRSLDALVVGTNVTLYATTIQGMYSLVDTGGYSADFTQTFGSTPLVAPASGTEFRGLAVLVPEPSGTVLLGIPALALLRRRRKV